MKTKKIEKTFQKTYEIGANLCITAMIKVLKEDPDYPDRMLSLKDIVNWAARVKKRIEEGVENRKMIEVYKADTQGQDPRKKGKKQK